MALKTSNIFGRITISDRAIAMVASNAAMECYGVADLVSRRLTDSLAELFNKIPNGKGIKVATVDNNKIYIDVYAILKDGVNIDAVTDSLRSVIIYNVEKFTGMSVKDVKINILGIKV